MKKFKFLAVLVLVALMCACSTGYNEKKCDELLNKNISELTVSDVEQMLDQCDAILDSFPKEVTAENFNELISDPKFLMLSKLSAKVAAFQYDCAIHGREMPESIQKKMDKVLKKANDIIE